MADPSSPMSLPEETHYVIGVIIDPALAVTVALEKRRGPAHLIGRTTFPGGHVESGESPEEAIAREIEEECGIAVAPSQWVHLRTVRGTGYRLDALAAVSARACDAAPIEDEPVSVLRIDELIRAQAATPERFARDLPELLALAMERLGVDVAPESAPAARTQVLGAQPKA